MAQLLNLNPPNHGGGDRPLGRRARIVLLVFAATAAVLLSFEYRAQLLGVLPWLLLALCPLMHLFMHGGHGGHRGDGGGSVPAAGTGDAR